MEELYRERTKLEAALRDPFITRDEALATLDAIEAINEMINGEVQS